MGRSIEHSWNISVYLYCTLMSTSSTDLLSKGKSATRETSHDG